MQIIAGSNDLSTPVPINTQAAIPFESPLMVGKFILHIRCGSSTKCMFYIAALPNNHRQNPDYLPSNWSLFLQAERHLPHRVAA